MKFRCLSDAFITQRYYDCGCAYARESRYERKIDRTWRRWNAWERRYTERGFRAISFTEFINAVWTGKNIQNMVGQKRSANESVIRPAEELKKQVAARGDISPTLDVRRL